MRTEDFVGGKCPVCGKPLVYEEGALHCFNNDSLYEEEYSDSDSDLCDIDMCREIVCQNCGCHLIACHHKDGESVVSRISDDMGYGRCFMCGYPLCWQGDFMRSDLSPDISGDDDDALVVECTCAGCGSSYTIYEPTVNEMKLFQNK